jgi:hypothetical protein
MFVYKKNTLEREISPIDAFTAKYLLRHTPTGVTIEFKFIVNAEKIKSEGEQGTNYSILNKRLSFASNLGKGNDSVKENILGPYKVYKLDANNNYAFVKDLYDAKKTLLENFKDAIDAFEQSIFNELKEVPSTAQPPQEKEENNAPKVSELPVVGDFVRVKKDYGRVVDVDEQTRMVKIEKMSQQEVSSLLRLQQQSQTPTKEMGGLIDSIMKSGGELVSTEGFFVVQVEPSGSNLKILRINEPSNQPPEGEEPQEPQEPQEMPDNVEDPLQENESQEQSEENQGGEGQGGEGEEGEEGEGEEGEGEEGEGEGEEGEGEEGEGQEGEGEEGEGEEGEEGEGEEGEGEEGESQEGEGQEGGISEDEDEFGDDDDDEDPLSKIKGEIQKAQKDLEKTQKQAKDDVEVILNLFNMDLPTIKKSFISASTLKRAIGDTQLFSDNNNIRIQKAIDLIFSL